MGKQRELGQSDAEYKSVLFRSSIVKEINSLWAMYSQISRYLNIGIVELYKGLPALKLDGQSKLNGLFRFDPLEDNEFLMNGHYYMSGTEPMEPSLRPASVKIYALGLMDFDYFAINKLIESIKPIGVSAYLEVDINVPNCDEIRLYKNGNLLSTNDLIEREFWLTETSVEYDDLPTIVDKVELYLSGSKVAEFVTRLYFTHFIKYQLEIV
ncbi:MAG: hypothetical protein IPL26_23830 [Leptospiraceae bacterium]|nr:hypothetical protein [Leptospiraceae bacterium]